MLYIFVGEDYFSKDTQLEKIKREFFNKNLEVFNYDVFFGRDLEIKQFQESLKRLPQKAKKRIVLIRQADLLTKELKDYICSYVKKPFPSVILVLDFEEFNPRESFNRVILKCARIFHFRSKELLDTFRLSREIDRRRIKLAFKILHNLLLTGTEPEMILGGLRYCWQTGYLNSQEKMRRLSLLMEADLNIKSGKLKADLALEKLIFSLCCL